MPVHSLTRVVQGHGLLIRVTLQRSLAWGNARHTSRCLTNCAVSTS